MPDTLYFATFLTINLTYLPVSITDFRMFPIKPGSGMGLKEYIKP